MNQSLNDLWREYRDKIYPTGVPADQNRELHQAFMAGAFVVLQEVAQASRCENTPEAETAAANHIYELQREALEWTRLRASALTDRNRN